MVQREACHQHGQHHRQGCSRPHQPPTEAQGSRGRDDSEAQQVGLWTSSIGRFASGHPLAGQLKERIQAVKAKWSALREKAHP